MVLFKKIKIEKYYLVALSSWLNKIISISIQIISLSILAHYLSIENFAKYLIIISLVPWFQLLDFGFGSAFQNKISEKLINNENYESYISTYVLICSLILFIGIIVSPLIGYLISVLLNNEDNKKNIELLIYSGCSIMFIAISIANSIQKLLYSLNKGILANLYMSITSVTSVLLLILINKIFHSSDNKLELSLFAYGAPIFISIFFGLIYICINYFKKFKIREHYNNIKELWKVASKFFLLGIFSSLVLNIDYIIMSRNLNAAQIGEYGILYKFFFTAFSLYVGLSAAVWPRFTQLYYSKKGGEIKRIIDNFHRISFVLMAIFTAFFSYFYTDVMKIIAPKMSIKFDIYLITSFAFYILIRIWTESYSVALQAINKIDPIIFALPFQSFISITCQWYLSILFGPIGIVLGLILSFLLTVSWILPLNFTLVLSRK